MADPEHPRTALTEREIRTPTGDRETLLLRPISENLFRAEESSFVTGAVYLDVIRAIETHDGALLFIEITERSPLITSSWILSEELIHSNAVQDVLQWIMEQGGNWEQVFGGVLVTHTPREIATEVNEHMRRIAGEKKLGPS